MPDTAGGEGGHGAAIPEAVIHRYRDHRLGRWINRHRFDQLHRYFIIRDGSVNPPNDNEDFWWHLEPMASIIRLAFQRNWEPGSHLAIDESMIPFRGNSSHTIKMKNKPIKEGFKAWVLGDEGYV
jgi:hypothetical protein